MNVLDVVFPVSFAPVPEMAYFPLPVFILALQAHFSSTPLSEHLLFSYISSVSQCFVMETFRTLCIGSCVILSQS